MRFSSTSSGRKFSARRKYSAAISIALRGISPTISLPTTGTPYRSASRRTVSKTRCSGVCSKSVRLIETCARLREAEHHAHRFDEAETAARKADGLGDPLGDVHIRRAQVDVVSDEEFARPQHNGAGRGMAHRLADIGRAAGFRAHLFQ